MEHKDNNLENISNSNSQDKKLENKSNIMPKKWKNTVLQKINVVNETNKYSIHFVADKYNIDRASTRDWKNNLKNYKKFLIKIIIEFLVVELNF